MRQWGALAWLLGRNLLTHTKSAIVARAICIVCGCDQNVLFVGFNLNSSSSFCTVMFQQIALWVGAHFLSGR